RVAGAGFHQLAVALGLGLQHLLRALGLGEVAGEDGVGLAAGLAPGLLGLGLGGDLDALLLDLLRRQFVLGEAGEFLLALGDEDGLLALGHGHIALAAGLSADLGEQGVGVGHLGSAGVLTLDRARLRLGHAD